MLGFVDCLVVVKLLTVVITSPEISVDFCSIGYVVSDHLKTSYLSSITHDKSTNILASSLVETKYPHSVLLSTLGVMSELTLVDLDSFAVVTELVSLVMILEVNVNQLSDSAVYIIHILVLKVRDLVLFQITERLHRVEASREVVEDDSQYFHQSHMVKFEDSALTDVYFDVSAFKTGTLEEETILLFGMIIRDSHLISAYWTSPTVREHTFSNHPSHSSFEVLGDPIDVQISLESVFNHISFDRSVLS